MQKTEPSTERLHLTQAVNWSRFESLLPRGSPEYGRLFEHGLPEDPVAKEEVYQLLEEAGAFTEQRLARVRRALEKIMRGASPALTDGSEKAH